MTKEFNPQQLDVEAFAQAGATLHGEGRVGAYERLLAETGGHGADHCVTWSAGGEQRVVGHVQAQPWLHLRARATLALACQRCLDPVDTPVEVDRWFRFVEDEATAQAQDEESEEDVLAISHELDLLALVEDELLMEMPLVPRHESCPEPVRLRAGDDELPDEGGLPHPFAALGRLKSGGS
jgi:uncharacterized protein